MKKLTKYLLGMAGAAGIAAGYAATANAQADPDPALFAALMEEGDDIYHSVGCSSCHGNEGEGGIGPELAGNEILASATTIVGQILQPDEEHGQMPAFANELDNREVAAVATYIRNSWGNEFGIVTESTPAALRLEE